jgi:hypothetical protein
MRKPKVLRAETGITENLLVQNVVAMLYYD